MNVWPMLLGNMDRVPPNFAAPNMAILGGGPLLMNFSGECWPAAYVNSTGDLYTDLRSNVAAELRAKLVYERLLQQTDDPGVKDMIRFLLSREGLREYCRLRGNGRLPGYPILQNVCKHIHRQGRLPGSMEPGQ